MLQGHSQNYLQKVMVTVRCSSQLEESKHCSYQQRQEEASRELQASQSQLGFWEGNRTIKPKKCFQTHEGQR